MAKFAEMHVNVIFVKSFVQRNEFNSCQRMVLYKNYVLLPFENTNIYEMKEENKKKKRKKKTNKKTENNNNNNNNKNDDSKLPPPSSGSCPISCS